MSTQNRPNYYIWNIKNTVNIKIIVKTKLTVGHASYQL